MKIEILKPTIVNGESVAVGDELEVSDKEGKVLCASKKAKNLDEMVELELTVDVKNTEAFEELKYKLEEVLEANATLIVERDDLKNQLETAKVNLAEHKGEVVRLNMYVDNRDGTLNNIVEDIKVMPLKDLRDKYKNFKIETEED